MSKLPENMIETQCTECPWEGYCDRCAQYMYRISVRFEAERDRWKEIAGKMAEFMKNIRPFLGNDPEATLWKDADGLISAYEEALKK